MSTEGAEARYKSGWVLTDGRRKNLGRWKGRATCDPAPLAAALRAAFKAGLTSAEIGRAAHVDPSAVRHYATARGYRDRNPANLVLASTSDRILDAVEYLIGLHRARLSRALDAVKSARPSPPEPKFPTEPLRELIIARCGSLKGAAHVGRITHSDLRHLYDDTVSLDTADRLCLEFGVMLEELYADNEDAA